MNKAIIILLSLFMFQHVHAGDLNFETTAEGITEALTQPKTEQEIKTRSIKGTNAIKTRGITIVIKEQGQIVEKTITISEDQPVQGVNLKIEFDFDSYNLRPECYGLLNELGKALTGEKLKDKHVVIKGHTDSDGDNTYNLKLSLNRAIAIKSYLKSNFFILPSLLEVTGYGEAMPLVPNDSEANKQINRRVEIEALENP